MLSNPERHFLPSHYIPWDWTKNRHDPPITQKPFTPIHFQSRNHHKKQNKKIITSTCNFPPLKSSEISHLESPANSISWVTKFHCWGRPINKETHKASLKAAWKQQRFPRRYAGHFEVASGTHWQGGEVTFKWIYAVLTFSPLKIGIVGRQSCSLFGGGSCLLYSGANLLV